MFLLLLIAWSFLPLAIWRSRRGSLDRGGLSLLVGLARVAALGLPLPETPAWLSKIARAVPALLSIAGGVAAVLLASRSRAAASTMALGVTAAAAWALWLRAYLFDDGLTRSGVLAVAMPYAAAGIGVLAAVAIVRAGGSLFRMLLAAAFAYLSFQAVRNINLFGLAGGAVLAWNLGEWLAELVARTAGRLAAVASPARGRSRAGRGAGRPGVPRGGPTATIRAWETTSGSACASGRGRTRHEAARFAGRPGLPEHALVFHLGQAGVYVYHNGPGRKVFMDGRLEVPSLVHLPELRPDRGPAQPQRSPVGRRREPAWVTR